jgi:hypothetical protein
MQQAGLKAEFVTTRDAGSLAWNVFGWQQFFSNFVTHPRIKAVARRIGSIVSRLLGPIERKGLRGSTYTIVFQKAGK